MHILHRQTSISYFHLPLFTAKNPKTWVNPLRLTAHHTFEATNAQELSIRAGQTVYVAPREVQQTQKLLETGWALATLDYTRTGLVPINYLKREPVASAAPQPQPDIPVESMKAPSDDLLASMPMANPITIAEMPVNIPVVNDAQSNGVDLMSKHEL